MYYKKVAVRLINTIDVSIRAISFLNKNLNFLIKVRLRCIFVRMLNIYVFSIIDNIHFFDYFVYILLTSNF